MKLDCHVVRDLLPLYAEDMVSAETAALVREHLCECADCRKELDEFSAESFTGAENYADKNAEEIIPLKRFAKKLNVQMQSMSYALIILFVFLGLFITEGSDMMYNSLIMPAVGVFGYYSFRFRALYKLPVILVLIEAFAFLFGLLSDTDIFSLIVMWSGIYLAFIYLGVAVAALFHYAFRKE